MSQTNVTHIIIIVFTRLKELPFCEFVSDEIFWSFYMVDGRNEWGSSSSVVSKILHDDFGDKRQNNNLIKSEVGI
jgi:hypothetical protein